jgi:hypothetical protein
LTLIKDTSLYNDANITSIFVDYKQGITIPLPSFILIFAQ